MHTDGEQISTFLPQHPFSAIISGSSKSRKMLKSVLVLVFLLLDFCSHFLPFQGGKTTLCTKILKDYKYLTGKNVTKLSLLFSQWQPSYQEMIDVLPVNCVIETSKTLPASNNELMPHAAAAADAGQEKKYRPLTKISETPETNECHVIVIDDLVHNLKRSEFVEKLFSLHSSDRQITIFLFHIFTHSPITAPGTEPSLKCDCHSNFGLSAFLVFVLSNLI